MASYLTVKCTGLNVLEEGSVNRFMNTALPDVCTLPPETSQHTHADIKPQIFLSPDDHFPGRYPKHGPVWLAGRMPLAAGQRGAGPPYSWRENNTRGKATLQAEVVGE
ncbi:hypothetical protein Bbelb_219920 [Branchiostoma belcheri]|nr:hypothetical protein Bbelb_219920 [Branchiostoma belcheri]